MASPDDLYAVLGVPQDATSDQIRHAYLTLARHYHPDTNRGTTRLGTHFQRINHAYAILSKPASRAEYDASRAPAPKRKRLDPSVLPPGFDGRPRTQRPSPPAPAATAAPVALVPWWDRHFILSQTLLIGAGLGLVIAVFLLLSGALA